MPKHITKNSTETQKLAAKLASTFKGGEILALYGDLGSGKTTFTQGLLKALGAPGPYTSPTFVVMKNYKSNLKLLNIYHIDAYRIDAKDLLELGFTDFAGKPNTITIVEWAERIEDILPSNTLRLKFKWLSEHEREITFK